MAECHYCQQEAKHTACNGNACCDECWEEGMKDWTPEKEEALKRASEELREWLPGLIADIRKENGVDGGMVCTRCRKMVQSDANGDLSCDCYNEASNPE